MSFDMEILLSHLDAEYRIELDQYKEESDSDVSDTEDANAQLPDCPIAQLPRQQVRSAKILTSRLRGLEGLTTTGRTG